MLKQYGQYLKEEERGRVTAEKCVRDVRESEDYLHRCGGEGLDKESMLKHKQYLKEYYKTTSANSTLAAVNGFLKYIGRRECRVKLLKTQWVQFSDKEKESTEKDYARLVYTTEWKEDIRVSMLLQTTGSAGIRISEFPFITAESLETGRAGIYNKGKFRIVLLPVELVKILRSYCRKVKIWSGSIFITRNGKLTDRSNINKRAKLLGRGAGVDTPEVFPHNLRHLSAKIFYSIEKDVVRLMDLLGHSSTSTTRIYTMSIEEQPRGQMPRMRPVPG